jgi:hypothetical protein
MIQVTETVWLPYPKYKPERSLAFHRKEYLTLLGDGRIISQYPTLRYINADETFIVEWDIDDDVVWFAEKPTLDPDATEFNFTTAKRLMEGGEVCMSMASDRQFKIDGKHLLIVYVEYKWLVTDWKVADIALAELEGKWRKV